MAAGLPAISVLMPVRNEERFLPAALRSIQRQSLTNWELVVVDDRSTDQTPRILADAAARDSRIRVLRSSTPGLVPALNDGLAACRAPVIARMDGDDISHPQRLAHQLHILEMDQGIGLVACTFRHFPRADLKIGMLAYESWQNTLASHDLILRDLYVESPFVHPGVMFRRDVVLAVGGYRDMGWAEDYDLWLRLAASGVRFARSPRPLFFWRDRPERATRTMAEYTPEAFRACKVHHLRNSFLHDETSVILAGAGIEGRAWRRSLDAAGITVAAWVDVDPRKTGRLLHGAPVLAASQVQARGSKLLITVGTRGARQGVRQWAAGAGFREGLDFICVT